MVLWVQVYGATRSPPPAPATSKTLVTGGWRCGFGDGTGAWCLSETPTPTSSEQPPTHPLRIGFFLRMVATVYTRPPDGSIPPCRLGVPVSTWLVAHLTAGTSLAVLRMIAGPLSANTLDGLLPFATNSQ